jgi:TrmH family RNA methyltransferase
MREYKVILVNPKYAGNIGSVARSMMNFNFKELILVNPPEDNLECRKFAMHAYSIIENAESASSLAEVSGSVDLLVGSSARTYSGQKVNPRSPINLFEFSEKIMKIDGKIGLVFGSEDYGLSNEDLDLCDILITIPTSPAYKSMNLSHAVNLILWEIFKRENLSDHDVPKIKEINGMEKEKFIWKATKLLDEVDFPKNIRRSTEVMLRRLLGRSGMSEFEYHRLMGILHAIEKKLKDNNR